MEKTIIEIFKDAEEIRRAFLERGLSLLVDVIQAIVDALHRNNKIMIFGNGGSAADAQHIAAEFVNRFAFDRDPLPALALTTDSSVLTAIANDYGYDLVFEKQIRALGRPGDIAWGISTSGKSPNVVTGIRAARECGLTTIGFGGPGNCEMKDVCKYYISVEDAPTPRIQELHILLAHIVAEICEREIFNRPR